MNLKKIFRTAQRLFVEGKINECIDSFTQAINAGEKTEIAFLSRGVAFLKTERTDDAIKDFSAVVSMNDNNMRAYFYRGIAYMSKADFNNAIRDFDRTIELKPDHGAAFLARGSSYAQSGNTEEAARNFRTAIIYSETEAQSLADTFGIFRTQFDKALTIMAGGKVPSLELTDEETDKLKKWLEE